MPTLTEADVAEIRAWLHSCTAPHSQYYAFERVRFERALAIIDSLTAQIARKDEALKRYEQASDDLYSFATRLKRRASSAMEDR